MRDHPSNRHCSARHEEVGAELDGVDAVEEGWVLASRPRCAVVRERGPRKAEEAGARRGQRRARIAPIEVRYVGQDDDDVSAIDRRL